MALSVDIQKRLGRFQLSVQFETGNEPLALLGASGCGKSVTLRCIAGILTPDEGKIVLDGETLYDSAAGINLPPQRRKTGYLFQQYALFPHMTVRQNIAAAVRSRQLRQAVAAEKIRQFRLEDAADKKPCQLSGGQQQRAALARILASDPRSILLDEPLSALDSYLKYQLELELAEAMDGFSGTVLWVSHDLGEVYRNCRRVCVLEEGRSQGVRTLEDLLRRPETEAAARLSGCKNFADVLPAGCAVTIPDWAVTLKCGCPVPDTVRRIGIRARHVSLAPPEAENAFPCRVTRVIEDLSSAVVLLTPLGACPGAPLLRMELDSPARQLIAGTEQVTVAVQPRDILLLK